MGLANVNPMWLRPPLSLPAKSSATACMSAFTIREPLSPPSLNGLLPVPHRCGDRPRANAAHPVRVDREGVDDVVEELLFEGLCRFEPHGNSLQRDCVSGRRRE